MEWVAQKDTLLEIVRKYRYVLLAALIGIFLMTIPQKETELPVEIPAETQDEQNLEESLCEILSGLSGAGNVQVLLTQLEGEKTIYQTDEDISGTDVHRDTVLVTDSEHAEAGLIRQINPPVYRGAIVLCQGADNARVRLAIVEAVKSVTGISSDNITVLKMK